MVLSSLYFKVNKMPDRRQFLGMMLMPTLAMAQRDSVLDLPPPQTPRNTSLIDALKARKSTREFSAKPLDVGLVSNLLWTAFGINRPDSGKRTAPSAHNWQEIEVYAALPQGMYQYDAAAHTLRQTVPGDLRRLTGVQDFVERAPLNLVYVANLSRMTDTSAEDRAFYLAADTGFIAQNVYLFCASEGLATVVRGLVDRKALAAAMRLRPDQRIVLAQTVGYPVG
jgi:SagB-type dehydrogenase family enzyme